MQKTKCYKKNDLVALEITDLTEEGQGVGKCDGLVFFVKGSVMGDVVEAKILKVKKNYAYAKVEKLLEASPFRVTPLCPVAGKCGGCQLQHLSYEKELEWNMNGLAGAYRFINRLYLLISSTADFADKNASKENNYGINLDARSEKDKEIQKKLHQTVKKVTDSIEDDFHFNTAIAAIMELLNDMTTYKQNVIDKNDISSESKKVWHEVLEKVILLIAPFAPHVADELWSDLGNTALTFEQEWPTFDEKLTVENNFNLVLQVNGKVRDMVSAQIGISKDDAEKLAFSSEKVQKFIDGKEVIKVIVVPNKLVNIVVKG